MYPMTQYAEYWELFCLEYLTESNQKALEGLCGDDIESIAHNCMAYYSLTDRGKALFANYLQEGNDVGYSPVDFILHEEGGFNAPAWMLLRPEADHLLPNNTWLIHFSDHAADIKQHGFIYGVPDINRIALTFKHNMFSDKGQRVEYKQPGYNYAYQLSNMKPNTRTGYYGKHAILFRGTGLSLYHDGDRERQTVFWGPSANTANGIVITGTPHGWVTDVGPKGKSIDDLVNRIMKNF
jgi:hypothetical protein